MKLFDAAEDRLKNNLLQSTHKFRRVAEFARVRMQNELRAGNGDIVYPDYITALDKYLIPFFGTYDAVTFLNITGEALIGILHVMSNGNDACIGVLTAPSFTKDIANNLLNAKLVFA